MQTVMQVNASNYVHQDVCKVKADSSGIICGSREFYFKGKFGLMINITWVKSPRNYVNFLLESPLNSLNLKICQPCNLFLAKVRENQGTWVPKSHRKSRNVAKKLRWNPDLMTLLNHLNHIVINNQTIFWNY